MFKFRKKILSIVCVALIAGQSSLGIFQPINGSSDTVNAKEVKEVSKAKNVIMMIPDGTSVESVTLARWPHYGFSSRFNCLFYWL